MFFSKTDGELEDLEEFNQIANPILGNARGYTGGSYDDEDVYYNHEDL